MKSNLTTSRILKTVARIVSIPVVILDIALVMFTIFMMLVVFGGGLITIYLYQLLLVGMLIGIAIAWRKENLGFIITLVFATVSLVLRGENVIPWFYHNWNATLKLFFDALWIMPLVPALLFLVSWLISLRGSNYKDA